MTRWIQFRLSVIGACMSFLIALVAVIASSFSPDVAQYSGIIISYGFSIQSLCLGLVDHITNTESEIPAVERIEEYQHLPDENEENEQVLKQLEVPKVENNRGVVISDLRMRYRPELPLALKGVNIHIEQGDHVAIVGRTGSGKSSLAITLFKLYMPELGCNIQVDDDQLSRMPLYKARRELAIIPQEPFLFSGTLRQQLCEYSRNKAEGLPTEGFTRIPDEKLWEMLEIV